MAHYNINVSLSKIKGAKVMDIQGKTSKRKCIVIPIDNYEGTVIDNYEGRELDSVQLRLTAFNFVEEKFGRTHGLKPAFSRSRMAEISKDELRNMQFCGHMSPWPVTKPEQESSVQSQSDDMW